MDKQGYTTVKKVPSKGEHFLFGGIIYESDGTLTEPLDVVVLKEGFSFTKLEDGETVVSEDNYYIINKNVSFTCRGKEQEDALDQLVFNQSIPCQYV